MTLYEGLVHHAIVPSTNQKLQPGYVIFGDPEIHQLRPRKLMQYNPRTCELYSTCLATVCTRWTGGAWKWKRNQSIQLNALAVQNVRIATYK